MNALILSIELGILFVYVTDTNPLIFPLLELPLSALPISSSSAACPGSVVSSFSPSDSSILSLEESQQVYSIDLSKRPALPLD